MGGRESGKPRPVTLKTDLWRKIYKCQPASVDYLRFCSKENVSKVAKMDMYIMCLAALHGHLPLLQKLNKPLQTFSTEITGAAARGGQLETLKWLRSKGCPWDEDACAGAAESGHLEMVKWLRSEGCPWDARVWGFFRRAGIGERVAEGERLSSGACL